MSVHDSVLIDGRGVLMLGLAVAVGSAAGVPPIPSPAAPSPSWVFLNDTDISPHAPLVGQHKGLSIDDCAQQCSRIPNCVAVVFNGPRSRYHNMMCGFKCSSGDKVTDPGEQAAIVRPGVNTCDSPPPPPPAPPPPPPPPPPMVPMPAEWTDAVNAAQMLYGGTASLGPLPLYPAIANGYVGVTLGCFPTTCGGALNDNRRRGNVTLNARSGSDSTNCVSPGVLHIGGVFSGAGTASERAALPGVHSVYVTGAGGAEAVFAGSALDLENATFINRTRLPGCGGTVLEQRWYAHRTNRSVLVYEMTLIAANSASASRVTEGEVATTSSGDEKDSPTSVDVPCVVELSSCNQNDNFSNAVTVSSAEDANGVVTRNCTMTAAESNLTQPAFVAQRFQRVPNFVALHSGETRRYVAAMVSSLADDRADERGGPFVAAGAEFASAVATPIDVLRATHAKSWAELRSSRVEIGPPSGERRNASGIAVAAAVNSSFYALLSSIRSDWPGSYGTSPGGLVNSAYEGHVFWDMETWHFPSLAPLYPVIGQQMLSYRSSRLAAARAEARAAGVAGARFPLESGLLGRNVCAWLAGSQHEIHTTANVAMAHRLHYRLTRNASWLSSSWPVIEGCAQFWASRVTPTATVPGGFTVLRVIGSDERAGVVDDDAYTNALAAETLRFASWAAKQVGASAGANWSRIAAGIVLPVVDGVYSDGPIHLENRQYKAGQQIEQSDVVLLQYPLDIPMGSNLKINDLTYWTNVTLDNGFYTGDSSYAIAWMGLGRRDRCDDQFIRAFAYQNGLPGTVINVTTQYNPFNIWKERAVEGGHVNFLTGAGGFLQNVIQGYAGLRAHADRVDFNPVLPPFSGIMRLVGLHYAGVTFSLEYTDAHMTVCVSQTAGDGLTLNTTVSRHVLERNASITLPVSAFSILPSGSS